MPQNIYYYWTKRMRNEKQAWEPSVDEKQLHSKAGFKIKGIFSRLLVEPISQLQVQKINCSFPVKMQRVNGSFLSRILSAGENFWSSSAQPVRHLRTQKETISLVSQPILLLTHKNLSFSETLQLFPFKLILNNPEFNQANQQLFQLCSLLFPTFWGWVFHDKSGNKNPFSNPSICWHLSNTTHQRTSNA